MNGTRSGISIEAKSVVKRYGETVVLDGIDFSVRAGEMFALLGPNGAGKTTFFSMLSTLRKPTSGQLRVCDRDVVSERSWVRRNIGIVFQDPALAQVLSVRENLQVMARFFGLSGAITRKRTEEMLSNLQLAKVADRPVRTLSGGQRRRLELARALMADPQVLCLDEATLGLDLHARRLFWSEVRNLAGRGKTVFFTTHYMEEADVADRIALIDKGRIIALDTPRALKARIGGGIIRLTTEDNAGAHEWLRQHGHAAEIGARGLTIVAADPTALVPHLLTGLPMRVLRVDVHEPSLEDVFLLLTGRSLSNGEAHNALQSGQ
jgi:ABC-2 type transport system ATP-binding protein